MWDGGRNKHELQASFMGPIPHDYSELTII